MPLPVNILLVDDEPRNLEVLESILGSPDYRLVRAQTAEAALLELVQQDFACIVLDIQMPGMNGLELARLIKTRKRSQLIPILFLTAYFHEEKYMLEGYGTGAVDYLTKPIKPEVLRSKVAVFVELFRVTRALTAANTALEAEVAQRQKAEAALREANLDLEDRVEKRTADLSRTNQELRDSEARFRMLIEGAPNAILLMDGRGRITMINAQVEKLFGYPRKELVGQSVELLVPARHRRAHPTLRSDYLLHSAPRPMGAGRELFGLRKDGSEVPIEIGLNPLSNGNQTFVVASIIDITERLQAEQALRRSEANLRDFVENATVGLHWVGPDGTILWANKADLDIAGHPSHEYVGRNIAEFHVDQALIRDILWRLENGEALHDCEAQLRRKDGSTRHVLIDSNALMENGSLVHTRCFTRDVTERKEAEQLRARLAAIVESSDDAIISKDVDGIIQTWNHSAERMFGFAASEAVGQSITLIVPPDRLSEESEILQTIRRGESRQHFQTIRRHKDGSLIHVSLSISPVKDANGIVVGASNISRDITEAKKAEAALRESEERFRTVANAAPVMIWMSGIDQQCFYFNKRWLDFTGRTLEQERANGWAEGVHPEDLARCLTTYTEAFDQRQPFSMDYRLRRADGEFRWITDQGVPRFMADGTFLGYIGGCIDITERREAEDVVRRSRDELETRVQQRTAQLARANEELRAQIHERRQLEALVLSISEREQQRIGQDLHDGLCQQLTGIKFRNKILEQKLTAHGMAEAEDAHLLETLLTQAVELARSQARGLNPVRLEADGLMTALEELAGSVAAVFGVECTCAPGEPVLMENHAVAIHLYRIAQEAITNAIKHGKARTVRLHLIEKGSHIRLEIQDNGVGFSEAAPKNGGTGLHIMNYRARTIGAELHVRRAKPGGTLVTCIWPKSHSAPSP